MDEREQILRALVALPARCHEVIDLLMNSEAEEALGQIQLLLSCSADAAKHIQDIFRVLSPAAQSNYRLELQERYSAE